MSLRYKRSVAEQPLAELRRRIAVAFSTAELSQFAARMEVAIDREGPIDAGARALVRAMSSRGQVDRLIAELRKDKPLFEWPDPPDPVPAPAPLPEPGDRLEPAQAPQPEPAQATEIEPARQPAPDLVPDRAPSPASGQDGASARAQAAPSVVEQALAALAKVDRRAAGLIGCGVALGVLATWLGSRSRGSAEPPAPIARLAAEQLNDSVAVVTRACGVDDGSHDSARDRLRRAFDRCGAQPEPGALRDPAPQDSPPPPPAQLDLPPPVAFPGGDSCLRNCSGAHRACIQARCGPEPSTPDQFALWQRCQTRCLVDDSRCRLACR